MRRESLALTAPAPEAPKDSVALRRVPTRIKAGHGHAGLERRTPGDCGRSQPEQRPRRQHRHGAAGRACAGRRGGRACSSSAASNAEPYILALLAFLAMVGVFSLFAHGAGILRLAGKDTGHPMLKAVVDRRPTASSSPIRAAGWSTPTRPISNWSMPRMSDDVRPVERVFIGDPDVSEAVYRLLKAAREGRKAHEEVRVTGLKGKAARWLRLRVRPLGAGGRDGKLTVWTVADVTRDRERQENIFQELQHAIDYLDHAPAGFFSVDGNGDIVYLNATLASWLDHDLAQVGSGGLKLADIVSGDGAALHDHARRRARAKSKPKCMDIDFKTRGGRTVPVRLFHKVAFGADGMPGASRTLVLNRASERRRRSRSAPPKCASCASSSRRRWRSRLSTRPAKSRAPTRCSPACFRGAAQGWRRQPLDHRRRRRARPCGVRSGDPQGCRRGRATSRRSTPRCAGKGERYGRFYVSPVEEEDRDGEAAIVYVLETTGPALAGKPDQPARPKWSRSANWPAASRTISTTCCPPS